MPHKFVTPKGANVLSLLKPLAPPFQQSRAATIFCAAAKAHRLVLNSGTMLGDILSILQALRANGPDVGDNPRGHAWLAVGVRLANGKAFGPVAPAPDRAA